VNQKNRECDGKQGGDHSADLLQTAVLLVEVLCVVGVVCWRCCVDGQCCVGGQRAVIYLASEQREGCER
jgi:hypothetical protein